MIELKSEKNVLSGENENLKKEVEKLKFKLEYYSNNAQNSSPNNQVQYVQPVQYVQTMPQFIPLTPTSVSLQSPLVFAEHNDCFYQNASELVQQQTFQFPAGAKTERLSSGTAEQLFSAVI